MSYVVTIQRKDRPISRTEFESAIKRRPDFTFPPADDPVAGEPVAIWRAEPGDRPHYFVLVNGGIDVTTPSNGALKQMQRMAEELGAEVVGEEGENLTDADIESKPPQSIGWGCLLLLILLITGIIYWVFLYN